MEKGRRMGRKYKTARRRLSDVEAKGELRKEPDWDKYAWATLQYVKLRREVAERKAAKQPEATR
jgi:hypothetical protein